MRHSLLVPVVLAATALWLTTAVAAAQSLPVTSAPTATAPAAAASSVTSTTVNATSAAPTTASAVTSSAAPAAAKPASPAPAPVAQPVRQVTQAVAATASSTTASAREIAQSTTSTVRNTAQSTQQTVAQAATAASNVVAPVAPAVEPPAVPEAPVAPVAPVVDDLGKVPAAIVDETLAATDEIASDVEDAVDSVELPTAPALPAVPELPVPPELPVAPELPALPEVPALPDLPQAPELPALPELPVAPEVPSIEEPPSVADVPAVDQAPRVADAVLAEASEPTIVVAAEPALSETLTAHEVVERAAAAGRVASVAESHASTAAPSSNEPTGTAQPVEATSEELNAELERHAARTAPAPSLTYRVAFDPPATVLAPQAPEQFAAPGWLSSNAAAFEPATSRPMAPARDREPSVPDVATVATSGSFAPMSGAALSGTLPGRTLLPIAAGSQRLVQHTLTKPPDTVLGNLAPPG